MSERILVLGAGKFQRISGAEHHDIIPFEGIEWLWDLNSTKTAWGLSNINMDEPFTKIIAHHVCEHVDSLINFMDRCWEILPSHGVLEIETPNAGMNPDLEFCDPTHVRCYRPFTFHNYFTEYGVEKFGYTSKAWIINEIKTFQLEVPDDCIYVNLTPIK